MKTMSNEEFDRMYQEAVDRVTRMDRTDGYRERQLWTIILALEAGLRSDLTCAFDALFMLKDIRDHQMDLNTLPRTKTYAERNSLN